MSVRFIFNSDTENSQAVNKWNQVDLRYSEGGFQVDSSKINTNDAAHFITQFRGCPDPEFNLKWEPNSSSSDLLILLTHYNPLQNIKKSLSMTEREMLNFLQKNNGLPSQYQSQIILFKDEIDTLSKQFGIDACKMADESDVIICCWGEFMESPYKEKHIFQGTSRGKVFIYSYPQYTQVQCTYSWD
jgi:hypothetical protein